MKVLMTADTVGGVLTHALDLATELAQAGDEVVLVTFGRRADAEQRRRIVAAGVAGWHESELALEWMDDPWQRLQAAAGELLLEIEAEERPDVVHLNAYGHAALALARAGRRGRPLLRVLVVASGPRRRAAPAWRRYRPLGARGPGRRRRRRRPVAVDARRRGAPYGPLAGAGESSSTTAAPRRRRPADVAKQPFALAAGRMWDAGKNLAPARRRHRSVWRRAACGSPARAARRRGRQPGVLGPLTRRSAGRLIAGHAAVFAAPARYEPFGLAILEAARDRCALVLGDIPSLRELWGADAPLRLPRRSRAAGGTLCRPARRPRGGAAARAPRRSAAPQRYDAERDDRRATGGCTPPLPATAQGGRAMKVVIFCHSLVSDWNHGNAHFLRGVATELHRARPRGVASSSRAAPGAGANLVAGEGSGRRADFAARFPQLSQHRVRPRRARSRRRPRPGRPGARARVERPRAGGPHRRHRRGRRRLPPALSRHPSPGRHRAAEMAQFDLSALRRRARLRRGHPAALPRPRLGGPRLDVARGGRHPRVRARVRAPTPRRRSRVDRQLGRRRAQPGAARVPARRRPAGCGCGIDPRRALSVPGAAGDRRPGLRYRGWLANHLAPEAFARHRVTVHVPRRPYVEALPGIPTIRVFEALACGIPLVCAPWDDAEGLFTPGRGLSGRPQRDGDGDRHARAAAATRAGRRAARSTAWRRSARRHTCAHRVDELLGDLRGADRRPREPGGEA